MTRAAEPQVPDSAAPTRWIGRGLVAGTVTLLVAAGLLLWWRHGAAVFGDYVIAAIAMCF